VGVQDWKDVAQDWDSWRAVVNAVMNHIVLRISCLAEERDSTPWSHSSGFNSYRVHARFVNDVTTCCFLSSAASRKANLASSHPSYHFRSRNILEILQPGLH